MCLIIQAKILHHGVFKVFYIMFKFPDLFWVNQNDHSVGIICHYHLNMGLLCLQMHSGKYKSIFWRKVNSLGDYKIQFKEKCQNINIISMMLESYRGICCSSFTFKNFYLEIAGNISEASFKTFWEIFRKGAATGWQKPKIWNKIPK